MSDGLDNESGYGENSPFALTHNLNGKIASLDLEDQNSMTFYHYVEEYLRVDYRYFKTFNGEYIDQTENSNNREFKLYARDMERNILIHVNSAGELMWEHGLYSGDRPKEKYGLRAVEATRMYNFVANLINSGTSEKNLFIFRGNK